MDFATLKQRLGRRRGFDGNDARLGDFINDAYMTICGRRNTWSWLRRTHQFGTHAPESRTASGATPGATFTNGSRLVSNMTSVVATQDTRTGAKIEAPDGTVNRIFSHDTVTPTNLYLEAPYGGATTSATNRDSWKIYWDEYPLPEGAVSIESIVCTGNGFVRHIRESSLLSPHMKGLTVKDYESYPQHYALERHTQIPAPDNALFMAQDSSVATFDPGTVFQYKYCYYNTKTQELGPMSPTTSIEIVAPGGRPSMSVAIGAMRSDYGAAIYRTKNGGSEFYHLVNVVVGGALLFFTDTVADSGLGFSHQDTDSSGNLLSSNIGSVAERDLNTGGSHHIRFWPPPDEEYLVDVTYFAAPQELTEGRDTPHIPRQYHPILLDLAESYALSEEENHGAAAQKRAYAMEGVDRMEREEEADPGTRIQIGRGEPEIDEALGSWPRTITG